VYEGQFRLTTPMPAGAPSFTGGQPQSTPTGSY
jgi:hypothetical protein